MLSHNPVIAVWREAFSKFKTKKGARSSIEALLKRIEKGNTVGGISPLVDVYNEVSLRFALSCGMENLDAIQGNLRLTVTEGGDSFLLLVMKKQVKPFREKCVTWMMKALCVASGTGGTVSEP